MSTNTAGAGLSRKEVRLGTDTVKVQTEEGNGLLFGASHRWGLGRVPRDHAEVVREDGGLPRLIGVEVVDDGITINEFEGAVRILKVQLREPVRGLVLLDSTGGTFRLTEVIRRRDLDSEIGAADDSVDVAGDSSGAYDGVGAFGDENAHCCVVDSRISY